MDRIQWLTVWAALNCDANGETHGRVSDYSKVGKSNDSNLVLWYYSNVLKTMDPVVGLSILERYGCKI